MCLNCGCNKPADQHNNAKNIVYNDLVEAANANGQTVEEMLVNFLITVTGALEYVRMEGENPPQDYKI